MQGIRKPNNQGLVVTTAVAVGDLCHLLPLGRKAVIRKIMWYNNTGALATLTFGTWDNTLPAALFVPLLPTIACVNTFDGELTELELPKVTFQLNLTPVALGNGTTGNIYVVSSVANLLVRLEIEEFGA